MPWLVGSDTVLDRMRSRRTSAPLLFLAALLAATSASAQQLPSAQPAPADDPRRGPRLEYKRGPAECLTEENFRREVAISLDGVDHLAADSPDVVQVRFERNAGGGFRVTIVYTNAQGEQDAPTVLTYYNCEILGRHAGWAASRFVPPAPDPPPPEPCPTTPAPACPPCPACRGCGTSQPATPVPPVPPSPKPWRMDLTVGLSTYVMMTSFLTADVGPAVGLAGEVRGQVFGVTAELRFVVPGVTYAREPIPGATSSYPQEFDLSQLSALLVPCARYKFLVGCGVAQLGWLIIQSTYDLKTQASYSFGPRLGFEVPFSEERFAVFGFGEVLFAPSPGSIQFTLPDPEKPGAPLANTRWKQSVASAFFGAGVSVKFR